MMLATFTRKIITNHSNQVSRLFFGSLGAQHVNGMREVKDAFKFYEERNINTATEYFQKSLTLLPLYEHGSQLFNQQIDNVALKLIECYAWKGEVDKIIKFTKSVTEAAKEKDIQVRQQIQRVEEALSVINKYPTKIVKGPKESVKDNFVNILDRVEQQSIWKNLLLNAKGSEGLADLQPWIHQQYRSSIAFIITSLIRYENFPQSPNYLKLSNTLLKNAEKSSQKNIVKSLILRILNLIRTESYLQAQGTIQYCLDKKKENLKPAILATNQQFLLLQLLLSKNFEKVQRSQESTRILQQYQKSFDLTKLILQIYLLDSV